MNKIYVVTPAFNAEETIERTLLSVTTQAGGFDLRYHVQDGGSNDDTVKILKKWKHELDNGKFPIQCKSLEFTYSSAPDEGMYDALIKGFTSQSIPPSAFMTWINADDILFQGALALIKAVEENFSEQQVSWICGAVSILKEDMTIVQRERPTPARVIKEGLCEGKHWDYIQQEGSFFRKWLWDAVDANSLLRKYKLAGDWNLWRLFAHHAELVEAAWPLGAFRIRHGQLSQANRSAYLDEIDSTISPETRSKALKKLGDSGGIKKRLLKAQYPTGDISIFEKSTDSTLRTFYKYNFGHEPSRPMESHHEHKIFDAKSLKRKPVTPPVTRPSNCTALSFDSFSYAKQCHWELFKQLDKKLYGAIKHSDKELLQTYQELLAFRFIKDNLKNNSRLLLIGRHNHQLLTTLSESYECWQINATKESSKNAQANPNTPYRITEGSIETSYNELPENYFDLVFSVSSLASLPQKDNSLFDKIVKNIHRTLKINGYSLHLFDTIVLENSYWVCNLAKYMFSNIKTINKLPSKDDICRDTGLYAMSEAVYNATWFPTLKKTYKEHGLASSLNILWVNSETSEKAKPPTKVQQPTHLITKNHTTPRFIIVTPCLNLAETIDTTIKSVLNQGRDFKIRYHIQDGGSTDGTLKKLINWERVISEKENYSNIHFSWASSKDKGMYDAIINAFDNIEVSQNDFMAWINGDDIFLPQAFSTVLKISQLKPEVQWIGGTSRTIDINGQVLENRHSLIPTTVIKEGLCDGEHCFHLQQEGMFFKKSLWFRSKHALNNYKFAGDWNIWRLFAQYSEFYQLNKPLGAFRSRKDQLSIKNRNQYQKEINSTIPQKKRAEAYQRLQKQTETLKCNIIFSENNNLTIKHTKPKNCFKISR